MMYPGAACRVTLYEGLKRVDEDLAAEVRAGGCPRCGGPLDYGRWWRHPRGCWVSVAAVRRRHGLCCRRCRRRVLPPSALFLGRKVYWAAVVLISVAVRQRRVVGVTADALCAMFEVGRDTLKRWISFFLDDFPSSARWRALRSRVSAEVRDDRLPDLLLAQFDHLHGPGEAALAACLTFLASAAVSAF